MGPSCKLSRLPRVAACKSSLARPAGAHDTSPLDGAMLTLQVFKPRTRTASECGIRFACALKRGCLLQEAAAQGDLRLRARLWSADVGVPGICSR